MANRTPFTILPFKYLAYVTDYSAFWLGRHSRSPKKPMMDSIREKASQWTVPMFTLKAVMAGSKNIPQRISAFTPRRHQSEPVTSGTSLVRNRRPGSAAESWAGAALDQPISSWVWIDLMVLTLFWTEKERLGYIPTRFVGAPPFAAQGRLVRLLITLDE